MWIEKAADLYDQLAQKSLELKAKIRQLPESVGRLVTHFEAASKQLTEAKAAPPETRVSYLKASVPFMDRGVEEMRTMGDVYQGMLTITNEMNSLMTQILAALEEEPL